MKNTLPLLLVLVLILQSKSYGQPGFEKQFSIPENHGYRSAVESEPQHSSQLDKYDVHFYKLDLEADNKSVYLKGSTTIGASVVADVLDTFVVELVPEYTIDSILINQVKHSFSRDYDDIIIPVQLSLAKGDAFEAQIYYEGTIDPSIETGIINTPGSNITYTLSEPFYASYWFPCKQILTDKADSVYVFVTTDENLKVGSNGLLTSTVTLPDNKVRYEWKSRYPIAYYLISICIGDYYEYDVYAKPAGLNDSILIQNYMYDESDYLANKKNLDTTAKLIEAFSDMYGLYPFYKEKYGHCRTPLSGGMEHQTMTTLGNFSFEIVAHELAHMWFGDYVTCGTWMDIWINEGFATYSFILAEEYLSGSFPKDDMAAYQYYGSQLEPNLSIYIPESEFNIDWSNRESVHFLDGRIFDYYISYAKGASILHMLRYEINNDSIFFQGFRDFLQTHQFGNAVGEDFKSAMEDVSGMDLTDFFDQWYYGVSSPAYNFQWFWAEDTLFIRSLQSDPNGNNVFKTHMDYLVNLGDGDTLLRLYQSQAEEIYKIPAANSAAQLIAVDPEAWLLKTVYTIRNEPFLAPYDLDHPNEFTKQIFPNPANDKLHLEFAYPEDRLIRVCDFSGRIILSTFCTDSNLQLDIADLQSGLYLIEINESGKRETHVISKQ